MAATAQWIGLGLPSCGPGLESQAHHLRFFQFIIELGSKKDENKNEKWPRDRPIF